jgi:plastocyanin
MIGPSRNGESVMTDVRTARNVTLTATKPGLYPITCTKHTPNMQGTLVVLPK